MHARRSLVFAPRRKKKRTEHSNIDQLGLRLASTSSHVDNRFPGFHGGVKVFSGCVVELF